MTFLGLAEFWGAYMNNKTTICAFLTSTDTLVRPEKWDYSQVGFGLAMLPVGALCFTRRILDARCFQNGHFGHISSTLSFYNVFQSLGGHASAGCFNTCRTKQCFRQAHCFSCRGLCVFLPVPPNPTCARSHIRGFPTRCLPHKEAPDTPPIR